MKYTKVLLYPLLLGVLVASCNNRQSVSDNDVVTTQEEEKVEWKDCEHCKGIGYFTTQCSVCGGSGRFTATITEKSTRTCPTCYGTGISPCDRCGNYGFLKCSTCSGTGGYRCRACKGTGVAAMMVLDGEIIKSNCGMCNGEGYETCASCGGKGRITCNSCYGSGGPDETYSRNIDQGKCSNCGGFGKMRTECNYCDGEGRIKAE